MADEQINLDDREKLIRMLGELVRILEAVIRERVVPLPEALQEPIRIAWVDYFENHNQRIFNATKEIPTAALEAVGLTGVQLEVKRLGFFSASRRFLAKHAVKELQNVLGWANIWLGSLTTVILVSEVLVELKEVIEKSLEMLDQE